MSGPNRYDPGSWDSKFTEIMTMLKNQNTDVAGRHEENKQAYAAIRAEMKAESLTVGERLSALEKWRYGLAGGLTVIGLLVGWIIESHK